MANRSLLRQIEPKTDPALSIVQANFTAQWPSPNTQHMLQFGVRPNTWDEDIVRCVLMNDEYRMGNYQGPRSTILDVGAHIGAFCTTMKRAFPASRVVALEAAHFNWPVLAHNMNYAPGIEAYENGIGEADGKTILINNHAGPNTGGNGAESVRKPVYGSTKTVTLSTLARLLGISRFDVVKLDCEGGEHALLAHAESAQLLAQSTYVVAEIHGKVEQAATWFRMNFKNVVLTQSTHPDLANVYAWHDH